ncbi:transposase [Sphingobacterium zhuxiongii]|uniref:Transposase n=2 Tax=Sphingobacterium zhuxiongii TaxID=2662364 RepID=A0A5Q0Q6M2_9SPHI|nr:transposase [Sphingobacterium sp. dk4302]QGA24894.1 transposase [Sphingobacterium sp. dk4302]QGA26458.1 transposase [Sphingobacterium sp. dk4302]QGA26473.1 transposase [Sphingobacterium sp. dk4302]QGA26484.1 transposase [Sphingobacterium sp. dk4302]QGA26495.1 transposase [Sphingobacterium sp. dk4302]
MARIFDESFKKMAVELSSLKGSVLEAAKELDLDASRLSKWRVDPRYNGGTLLPKNDKLTPEEQEIRELKKRLKEAELENVILKKAVAIFSKGD